MLVPFGILLAVCSKFFCDLFLDYFLDGLFVDFYVCLIPNGCLFCVGAPSFSLPFRVLFPTSILGRIWLALWLMLAPFWFHFDSFRTLFAQCRSLVDTRTHTHTHTHARTRTHTLTHTPVKTITVIILTGKAAVDCVRFGHSPAPPVKTITRDREGRRGLQLLKSAIWALPSPAG